MERPTGEANPRPVRAPRQRPPARRPQRNHDDEPAPSVEVTADATGDHVDLRVADNGPGVTDDRTEAIFRRAATGLHEDGTGSGFGPFFVDAVLGSYGGDAWVEDDEPTGAVVVLRIRRPAVDEPDGDGERPSDGCGPGSKPRT